MNNLDGYKTNGHEYRASEIDRSNTRRLKWMMSEAKKVVEQQDNNTDIKDDYSTLENDNLKPLENSENKIKPDERKMFNPNINRFAKFNNNNFK